MGSHELQQVLRSLCFNTEWKYAVFWKLKHCTRMVLSWEEAYYEKMGKIDGPAENKCFDGLYSHDLLGLVVAKMSGHVYALGEGVVGQVALSGKHQWIYADNYEMITGSSFECSDGWQNQFSAGIRTIAVISVVPHGVVQLGSHNKVIENVEMVTHTRDVITAFYDSSVDPVPHPIQTSSHNSVHLQGIPSRRFGSDVAPGYLHHLHRTLTRDGSDVLFSIFPYLGKNNDNPCGLSLPSNNEGITIDVVNKHGELELPITKSTTNATGLEHRRIIGTNPNDKRKCGLGITSSENIANDIAAGSVNHGNGLFHGSVMGNDNLCNAILPSEKGEVDSAHFSSDLIGSGICDRVRLNSLEFYRNEVFQKDLENMRFQAVSSHTDVSSTSLNFPAGCELHEALGPAFLRKGKYFDSETPKSEVLIPEIPEQVKSSQLTSNSHQEHLLEAVIAKVCQSQSDVKSETSICKSVQSLLTAENYPEPSSYSAFITDSANHSIGRQRSQAGEEAQHCLSSSGVSGVMSPRGYSSTCPSAGTGSEQFERSLAPNKNNKKRARAGENSRPRPRDRQLIQDRIKELRDLIPSGAKCSIDSLLERTIKHMLYLQSITKHADKLNKYSDIKKVQLCQKETSMVESAATYERGSSWAVEVGGNLKVCSIIVENLNKNGQMVVEMICEECSHFLEIAEAIKSLGLTILKGVTEAHGDKTWICFVVEGQSNQSLHRMDILWSLVQILQPKNAMQQ